MRRVLEGLCRLAMFMNLLRSHLGEGREEVAPPRVGLPIVGSGEANEMHAVVAIEGDSEAVEALLDGRDQKHPIDASGEGVTKDMEAG
jgi:hypothetical protein